jgi:hypothetical protein
LLHLLKALLSRLDAAPSADSEKAKRQELIEWVEKQALENLRFRIQDAETIAKESNATLTILLAALGGGIAYCAKLVEADASREVLAGMISALSYVAVLCGLLLNRCLKIAAMPVPTNEPRNLLRKDFSLNAIREAELLNVQARIDEAVARNDFTADWLNRVRFLAVLTPLVFGAAMVLAGL